MKPTVLDLMARANDHVIVDRPTLEACIEALEFQADPDTFLLAEQSDLNMTDRAAAVCEQLKYKLRQLPRKEQ